MLLHYLGDTANRRDRLLTLKQNCRHFDYFFITGCTGSCYLTTSGGASNEIDIRWKWHFRYSVNNCNITQTNKSKIITCEHFLGYPNFVKSSLCDLFPRCRVCNGHLCDNKTSEMEVESCNEEACVCSITSETFEDVFGEEPPTDQPIGWVEQDGEEGKSPEEPPVRIDDQIPQNSTVEIATDTECGRW